MGNHPFGDGLSLRHLHRVRTGTPRMGNHPFGDGLSLRHNHRALMHETEVVTIPSGMVFH